MIFSPTTRGFYDPLNQANYIAAGSWPDDGVVVSLEDWATYISQPPDGKVLGVVDGAPGWVDAPPPAPQSRISSTAFINRFQPAELGMLMGSPATVLLLITCAAAGFVELTDPAVQGGVHSLVPGILTSDRATAILTP